MLSAVSESAVAEGGEACDSGGLGEDKGAPDGHGLRLRLEQNIADFGRAPPEGPLSLRKMIPF